MPGGTIPPLAHEEIWKEAFLDNLPGSKPLPLPHGRTRSLEISEIEEPLS